MASSRLACFDPDRLFLATVTLDHRLKVVSVASGALLFDYQSRDHLTNGVTAIAWGSLMLDKATDQQRKRKSDATPHTGARVLALGYSSGRITLLNAAKGAVHSEIGSAHTTAVRGIAFHPDSSGTAYSGSDDGRVVEWDMTTASEKSSWAAEKKGLLSLALMPDKGYLLTAKHQIKVWDLASKKLVKKFIGHASTISGLRPVGGDSPELFVSFAEQERFVSVWDLASESPSDVHAAVASLVVDTQPIQLEVVSTSDKMVHVLALAEDGLLHVWQHATGAAGSATPRKPSALIKTAARPAFSLRFMTAQAKDAKPIACLAASFVRSPQGTSLLVARGASQRPTFETLSLVDDATGELRSGLQVLTRTFNAGILLDPQSRLDASSRAASGAAAMDGVTIAQTGGRSLARPGMKPADELSLAEQLQKIEQVAAVAQELEQSEDDGTRKPFRALNLRAALRQPAKLNLPSSVPKAVSLSTILAQALNTDDAALLESCLAISEVPVVQATVQRMSTNLVVPFLQKVVQLLARTPNRGASLSLWLRTVLANHTAYLMTVPRLMDNLGPLYEMIDNRLAVFKRLLQLSGRLDLIVQQVAIRQARMKQLKELSSGIATAVYEEGDLVEITTRATQAKQAAVVKDLQATAISERQARATLSVERTKAALLQMALKAREAAADATNQGMLGPISEPEPQGRPGGDVEDGDQDGDDGDGDDDDDAGDMEDDEDEDEGYITAKHGLFGLMQEDDAAPTKPNGMVNGMHAQLPNGHAHDEDYEDDDEDDEAAHKAPRQGKGQAARASNGTRPATRSRGAGSQPAESAPATPAPKTPRGKTAPVPRTPSTISTRSSKRKQGS